MFRRKRIELELVDPDPELFRIFTSTTCYFALAACFGSLLPVMNIRPATVRPYAYSGRSKLTAKR